MSFERHIDVGEGKRITLKISTHNDIPRLDARFFFYKPSSKAWNATKYGWVVPIDQLGNVIGALQELRALWTGIPQERS